MKVEWTYDSGYINREPWRDLEIPDEDLADLSEAEQERIIDERVYEAFAQEISPTWRRAT